jgi:hypothetical protein
MLHALWLPEITIRQGHVAVGGTCVQRDLRQCGCQCSVGGGAIVFEHLKSRVNSKRMRSSHEHNLLTTGSVQEDLVIAEDFSLMLGRTRLRLRTCAACVSWRPFY